MASPLTQDKFQLMRQMHPGTGMWGSCKAIMKAAGLIPPGQLFGRKDAAVAISCKPSEGDAIKKANSLQMRFAVVPAELFTQHRTKFPITQNRFHFWTSISLLHKATEVLAADMQRTVIHLLLSAFFPPMKH